MMNITLFFYLLTPNIGNNITTSTRADLHKCLPLHAFVNPTQLLFKKKNVANSKNDSEIWKKKHSISL